MNSSKHQFPKLAGSAFTLIELLVVISIIALLMVIGAPSVLNTLKSSRLGGAGDKLLGSLSEAQQSVFAGNYPIEVRFYKYPGAIGNDLNYRAYLFFRVSTTDGNDPTKFNQEKLTKIGSLHKLPEGVFISGDGNLSPALDGGAASDTAGDSGVAGATYNAVRFMTDGTCRKVKVDGGAADMATLQFMSLAQSHFTVVEDDGKTYTGDAPPKNFYTVQTDPFTGKSRAYRPGF